MGCFVILKKGDFFAENGEQLPDTNFHPTLPCTWRVGSSLTVFRF